MGHAMDSDSYVRIDEAARNVVRTEIILRRTGKLSMELANAKSIGRCRREGTRRGTGKKSAGCQLSWMPADFSWETKSTGGYSTISRPAQPRGHLAQERNVRISVGR